MLAALGGPATIVAATVTGVFNEPGQPVNRNGVTVITDAPTLLLSAADAATVTKDSTVITIDGTEYQAYEKTQDGAGFVELDLTRDF
jgi:hypothetical protein